MRGISPAATLATQPLPGVLEAVPKDTWPDDELHVLPDDTGAQVEAPERVSMQDP